MTASEATLSDLDHKLLRRIVRAGTLDVRKIYPAKDAVWSLVKRGMVEFGKTADGAYRVRLTQSGMDALRTAPAIRTVAMIAIAPPAND